MKKSVILLVVACVVAAAAIIYLNKHKSLPPPAPVAETASAEPEPQPQEVASTPKPQPVAPVVTATPAPVPVVAAVPAVAETNSNNATNSIHKTVDALLTAKSGAEKHNLFVQLSKNGQLDAAIDELKQRAAANPQDASIPTTLGEALLNKVRAMREAGNTDPTDLGIFALQADQQFNLAIKIDPKNWEAQFVKAATTFYWPPDAQRDSAAAQTLASLIDQQETLPTQPEFAQTYAALVKQYQKMGKMDEAAATLKLGLQKFPADPALQQMAAGQ
jgi:tetratricopeptide (TPR) repeat protein